MEYETVLVKKENHIATVTLNRPDRMNAFNMQMQLDLADALAEVSTDEDARVVVLTGAGKAFCAGADVGGMSSRDEQGGTEEVRKELRRIHRYMLLCHEIEKPTIAMINGVAVGGGFDLACACDIRIGCQYSRFMVAFTRVGLTPGWGGTWFLPRIIGYPKAAELIYTADFLEADEALRLGLLNKLVPSEALEGETMNLAEKIASGPPVGIRLSKIQLAMGENVNYREALQFAAAIEPHAITSLDHKEGVTAFKEKRKPEYRGI